MSIVLLVSFLLFLPQFEYVFGSTFNPRYTCGICQEVSRGIPCSYFDACHIINNSMLSTFGTCEAANMCDYVYHSPYTLPVTASALDVRVTKGFGTKNYSAVRLSVVTKKGVTPPFDPSDFEYSAPFKYKWTDNVLHSSIVTTTPGMETTFTIGTANISIWLPKQGAGVAGLLIADPCISHSSITSLVGCEFAKKFKTLERLPGMLNAMLSHTDVDFWGILGDNFYDRSGEATELMFQNFSIATKSKLMITVPGNHDYWVLGGPSLGTSEDQFANGHMQWYAMDAKSAETIVPRSNYVNQLIVNPDNVAVSPFNFSIDPSTGHPIFGGNLPDISNSFWYQQIGNIAIVGYSGGYSLEETKPFLEEACHWIGGLHTSGSVALALLVGHWDTAGLGCTKDMTVPLTYEHVASLDGCKELSDQKALKFFMGHTHCNVPHPHGNVDTGFMVAGQGMEGCGNYGFPIIDTTENRVRIWHFEVVSKEGKDTYDEVVKCISEKGWRKCTDMAEKWIDQPI